MPKMKTKSSAKKRFKVLGNGGVKRAHAFKRHILTKKNYQKQTPAARHLYGKRPRFGFCCQNVALRLKEFELCHA